jgi:hypothetical protein
MTLLVITFVVAYLIIAIVAAWPINRNNEERRRRPF